MSDPSTERLKAAVQALYLARPVEGPPGDNGQRSVWHLSPEGAELLSFIDEEGQVRRQELTLLDEHCVWMSGVGLRTGRVEHEGAARSAASSVVHPDLQPVPTRLLRAALALESYKGEDRYILHMQRVLALARQGLVLSGGAASAPAPAAPAVSPQPPAQVPTSPLIDPIMLDRSKREGLTMLIVLGVGLLVSLALVFWIV